jgi:hypothetical protein
MRRLFFFFMLIVLSISVLYAQRRNPFQNELYVGVGGGAILSSVDFRSRVITEQPAYRLGAHGGISIKHISDGHHTIPVRAGFVAELNFAQQGWQEIFEERPNFSYSRTLNYVTLPFMTHVNAGNRSVRFIFNAGPQIGLLLGDSYRMSQALADHLADIQEQDPGRPYGVQYQSSSHLRRFDYGIIGGTGLQIVTGSGHIDIEGRFYFGLGDIFESRRSRQAHFSRSANRVFGVRVTYYRRFF